MFIDTSGWFCLFDEDDIRYKKASGIYRAARLRVTHSYVIAELIGLGMSRNKHRSKMVDFVTDILKDREIRVIWVDETLTLGLLSCFAPDLINLGRFAMP